MSAPDSTSTPSDLAVIQARLGHINTALVELEGATQMLELVRDQLLGRLAALRSELDGLRAEVTS